MTEALVFSPLVGWPQLAALAGLAIAFSFALLALRVPAATLRIASLACLLAVLAGPQITEATTSPLPDTAIILADHSQSMSVGNRNGLTTQAVAALRNTAGTTQIAVVDVPPQASGGTDLGPALAQALQSIAPARLAGIIAVTDGEISSPLALPKGVPFSALLTAAGPETNRELRLDNMPAFGLVGQNQPLSVTIIDHGATAQHVPAMLTVYEDGSLIGEQSVITGTQATINLPVPHTGPIAVSLAVSPLSGAITNINNSTAFTLTGIQRHLNVLLISGAPDQSERTWRVLLKSDPAVQLVHFTILRTPGEALAAPPADLALIPFPVQQLFETGITKFDLVILDEFNPAGLLPAQYLANIAAFVRNGGALLTEAGPEFLSPNSLATSPLAPVLPAVPAAAVPLEREFSPSLTSLGALHPVTAPFAAMALPSWFRLVPATKTAGDTLIAGPDQLPLLILADAGKGRSAFLLSDQLWLWTRSGAHAGPAIPLLRRVVHWLLREPGLEADALTAAMRDGQLVIDRRSITGPVEHAEITPPTGPNFVIPLSQSAQGTYTASLKAPGTAGVWKVTAGGLTAYAANHLENDEEYQDLAATADKLPPTTRNIVWLGTNPALSLNQFIQPRHATEVTGTRTIPMLPPLPALTIVMALIVWAWVRESRPAV